MINNNKKWTRPEKKERKEKKRLPPFRHGSNITEEVRGCTVEEQRVLL